MSESKSRKPVYQDYYTDEDYAQIKSELPSLVKQIEKIRAEKLEPTIHEKRKVMEDIKSFIREKKRKVYGGTALNETLKAVDPDDAIYDEYTFSDIEFYSPTPVVDLVELTNMLYKKGYKYVKGSDAQHEETYSIFVNFQLYCDISYVPTRVYNGIQTLELDGILYVHPHFALIDYLRMFNDPINAGPQRWEKAFGRMYVLLKDYPLEYYDKSIVIPRPTEEYRKYLAKIKNEFLAIPDVQTSCLINGFEAYNFFIRHAMGDRTVEQQARTVYGSPKFDNLLANVPYLEFTSVNYRDNVDKLYNFIRDMVPEKNAVAIDEYYPLFQFTDYSATIKYKDIPLVRIFGADGHCIPDIKTTRGYMYVSFQYLLMTMLINKFRAHLDKDKNMYFNYGIAISNLVQARNIYLTKNNLPVINNTVFGEFRINCVGSTISYTRMALLRGLEKLKKGKRIKFNYQPESFFALSEEQQAKFDPGKHLFRNTSGNKISNPKNLLFHLDDNGNIISTGTEVGNVESDNSEETDSQKN